MASLAATNWTKPIALVPCLSWSTASCVFTQGVMSGAIPWKTLQEQFFENSVYQDEIRKLIISPEDDPSRAYDMGQQFVKDYSEDIEEVVSMHRQMKQHFSQSHIHPMPEICETSTRLKSMGKLNDILPPDSERATRGKVESDAGKSICDKSQHSDIAAGDDVIVKNVNNNHVHTPSVSSIISPAPEPTLTPDEYIARAAHPTTPSFSDEEVFTTIKTSDLPPANSIASSAPPCSGKPPFTRTLPSKSLIPPTSIPSPTPEEEITLSSGLPSSSPITDTSKSSIVKSTKRQKNIKKDTQPLTLNYAKTKQAQQLPRIRPVHDPRPLSLKHAIDKSGLIIPRSSPRTLPTDKEQLKNLQSEALDFMRGVMDECTHLGNFSVPVDPELVIIVSARQDAYIPKDGVLGLDQLWPGCEVRYVDQGHIGAVLLHQRVFRKAIADAFDRQVQKYYQNPGSEPSHQRSVKSIS